MTVSPQIKLIALVGGLAAAALAAGMFFLSRQPEVVDIPIPAPAAKAAPATPKVVAPMAKAVAAKPKPRPKAVIAPNGIPVAVMDQVAKHRIVVVAVYAGDTRLDRLARDEARAGARDAHAGFAAVDITDRRIAKALAEGPSKTLAAPEVLVFSRAGFVGAFHGFADRTLVAQLAAAGR